MLLYLVDIKVRTAVGPCDRWGLGSFEALTDGLMIDSPVGTNKGVWDGIMEHPSIRKGQWRQSLHLLLGNMEWGSRQLSNRWTAKVGLSL